MRILAIDPGDFNSAYLIYENGTIGQRGIIENEILCAWISNWKIFMADILAIEMIASYGMPVGKDVFETCVWIGRFIEAWQPGQYAYIYRHEVKMHLCNSMRAKDCNIRQAIIDKFPATGGGKIPQIGTKKQPGPLYGVKKDIWSALAIAITYAEKGGDA